jgi:hypothetical protein
VGKKLQRAARRRELIDKFVRERGWFIPALHEKYISRELEEL